MKTDIYEKENNEALTSNLRNCLSDLDGGFGDLFGGKKGGMGRIRAGSNDNFNLPMLDGREDESLENYHSNQLHEISGIVSPCGITCGIKRR